MRRVRRILIANFSYGGGGSELVASQLCLGLDRELFEPIACYMQWRGEGGLDLEGSGVEVLGIGRGRAGSPDYLAFRKLRRILEEKQIDLVHSHSTDSLADAGICRLLSPRLRHVHTFHFGNYPNYDRTHRFIERLFCRVPDRLVAVGVEQRKAILETYRIRPTDIVTIRNGIERSPELVDPMLAQRLAGSGKVIIGSISNLIAQKGLDCLLEVARVLNAEGQHVHFVVAGDGPLRTELLKARDDMGLHGIVDFIGRVPGAASRLLPIFDIYFQPSLWEAMSMSILEAMVAAKPIIATDVGEARHMIQQGVTGILLQSGDVQGMACAMRQLIAEPGRRALMGLSAQESARKLFSADAMLRSYASLYEDVLSN